MIEFIKSKTFFIHLLISAVLVFAILAMTYYWLGAYTKHGETIIVPDLKGKQWKTLEQQLASQNLKLKIADSSSYTIDKPGGLVLEQDPAPGSHVKENRTIYITVSKIVPPQVKMPNIIDVSDRQAEAILLSYGLKTGVRTYQPDLAKNAVLEMHFNGKKLQPGDEVPKGSVIDLVVGDGYGNTLVSVPDLVDRTYDVALFVLKGSSLGVGAVFYDGDVTDSMEAIVYRQRPEGGDSVKLKQGETVDLYLKRGN